MRKLATIRKIDDIVPIKGADFIELAIVDGWKCVVKKGEFKIGHAVIYCEVDSWIPYGIAPFLCKTDPPREYNGVKGERLKTVKLRGQISQGLILPLYLSRSERSWCLPPAWNYYPIKVSVGDDVTEMLGIQKWERPIPVELSGLVKGNWPDGIPKTDQERVQNIVNMYQFYKNSGYTFELTEKLEGTSATYYLDLEGEFHVCSRNINLKYSETNLYWRMAEKYDIKKWMHDLNLFGIAIQGEIIGEGIQGNVYKIKGNEFHVFDIYNKKDGDYINPEKRCELCLSMNLQRVPVIDTQFKLKHDIDGVIKFAEGSSILHKTEREGIVFKSNEDSSVSFKVISNKYLLGED